MVRLCKSILASLLILGGGSYCYALKTVSDYNRKHGTNIGKPIAVKAPEKSEAVLDLEKKLFDLKKFKLETIHKNLRIAHNFFSEILNKKIKELGLCNSLFDKLRKSATSDSDRIEINQLENKFLEMQIMIKYIAEGFPQPK